MDLTVQAAAAKTISSLDLLGMVNQVRAEEGKSILRHDTLLRTIKDELGEVAHKFVGYYVADNGKENPCYHLPEREACLVLIRESPKVRAMVYDRMRSLEKVMQSNIDNCITILTENLRCLTQNTVDLKTLASSTQIEVGQLRETVDQHGRKIDNIIQLFHRQSPKRRLPKPADRELVLNFTRSLGSCPCCFRNDMNLVVDHFYSSQRPEIQYIWAICEPCNKGLAEHRIDRNQAQKFFEAYHGRARLVGAFDPQTTLPFEWGTA